MWRRRSVAGRAPTYGYYGGLDATLWWIRRRTVVVGPLVTVHSRISSALHEHPMDTPGQRFAGCLVRGKATTEFRYILDALQSASTDVLRSTGCGGRDRQPQINSPEWWTACLVPSQARFWGPAGCRSPGERCGSAGAHRPGRRRARQAGAAGTARRPTTDGGAAGRLAVDSAPPGSPLRRFALMSPLRCRAAWIPRCRRPTVFRPHQPSASRLTPSHTVAPIRCVCLRAPTCAAPRGAAGGGPAAAFAKGSAASRRQLSRLTQCIAAAPSYLTSAPVTHTWPQCSTACCHPDTDLHLSLRGRIGADWGG